MISNGCTSCIRYYDSAGCAYLGLTCPRGMTCPSQRQVEVLAARGLTNPPSPSWPGAQWSQGIPILLCGFHWQSLSSGASSAPGVVSGANKHLCCQAGRLSGIASAFVEGRWYVDC